MINNRHPIRQPVSFIHIMCGENHRLIPGQPPDEVAYQNSALRIQPCLRLIQYNQPRIVDERQRNIESPLHAA
ncbi:hypothetical protein D3C73_1387080 [compost metagenome]